MIDNLPKKSLKTLRQDDALDVLRRVGPISAADFGWFLWRDSTEAAERGEGSHRNNKFCRSAGKILKQLEDRKLADHDMHGKVKLWRAI